MESDYLAAMNHALGSIFIVTKSIAFDEKDQGNDWFPHIEIGTILTVEAVICTDFGLDVRVSYPDCDQCVEFDIEYLATHCDFHDTKLNYFLQTTPVFTSLN